MAALMSNSKSRTLRTTLSSIIFRFSGDAQTRTFDPCFLSTHIWKWQTPSGYESRSLMPRYKKSRSSTCAWTKTKFTPSSSIVQNQGNHEHIFLFAQSDLRYIATKRSRSNELISYQTSLSTFPCSKSKNRPRFPLAAILGLQSLSSIETSLGDFCKYNVTSWSGSRYFTTSPRSRCSHEHRSCWKCGRDTSPKKELFFCECGVVQEPADSLTYFNLMQEEVSFDLNIKNLGTMFRETQKCLHPDMFSSKSKEEQALAEEQSSLLNKAYQTLLRPLSRAKYMLKLKGVHIDEKDTISDADFLMDIMSINEQISEASTSNDIDTIDKSNNAMIAACLEKLSQAFKDNKIEDAKKMTIKLRYYTTIQERINEVRRRNLG